MLYTGDLLTIQNGREILARLIAAFPRMTDTTAKLIIERMAANGFTRERAVDAVNNVIDTYEGWDKVPNIANFIGYDKRIKLYTYREMCDGVASWEECAPVEIKESSTVRWALKEDIRRYGLKIKS